MKSFLEFIYENNIIREANKNVALEFNLNDIKNLFIENEAEDISLKINKMSSIYKYLKDVVKNPEFFCLVLKELNTLSQQDNKLKGFFAASDDQINKFTSSSLNSKINLIMASGNNAQREMFINEIVQYFKDKKSNDPTYYIKSVEKRKHELYFTPDKNNPLCKKYNFNKIIIHIIQPNNNKFLSTINSGITEFLPTLALACIQNNKLDIIRKLQDKNLTAEKIVAILDDNKEFILKSGILKDESFLISLINGIANNKSNDIILDKIEHAVILVNNICQYINDLKIKTGKLNIDKVKLDNEKIKNSDDAADITTVINGKPLNFSVKDDKIDGSGHSIRDFSLLKRLELIPGLKNIYNAVSFDKFAKTIPIDRIENETINKKEYYMWMVNNTDKFEMAAKANKKIFAKVLQYVLNMSNTDTLILSLSGVHANVTDNKEYASYALHYINDMEKGDETVDLSIEKSGNESQLIKILKDGKPRLQMSAQIGAGKYNPIKKEDFIKSLNSDKIAFIQMTIKYKDLKFLAK